MSNSKNIRLFGVRTNNLKNIDLYFPLEKISVVTGASGCGKSSLVFETLYAESHRRYFESLSSFARQYLQVLPKPDMDTVENLPAAVAVRQHRNRGSSRSTVGSLSEVNDVLRSILALKGEIFCEVCKKKVFAENGESIAEQVYRQWPGANVLLLAPLNHFKSLQGAALVNTLLGEGFSRVLQNSKVKKLESCVRLNLKKDRIVIDRLVCLPAKKARFIEAAQLALGLGMGECLVLGDFGELGFDDRLQCCGRTYTEPRESLFNPNAPLGACPNCQGYGRVPTLNVDKVLPDRESSIAHRGVAPWNFGKADRLYNTVCTYLEDNNPSLIQKPFSQYSEAENQWLWHGDGKRTKGILGFFRWLDSKKYKPQYRVHGSRFRTYVSCKECQGSRLNPQARAVKVFDKGIVELTQISIDNLAGFLQEFKESDFNQVSLIVETKGRSFLDAVEEIKTRIGYLIAIGLGYLELNRSANTLSGGELQRLSMARSLGSPLSGTLFCLDEPSVGLHPKDIESLLKVIQRIKSMGNTIVLVEHDARMISQADHLVRLGPGAGALGGKIVFQGSLSEINALPKALPHLLKEPRSAQHFVEIGGADRHNLKSVEAKFPTNGLTVVCGVSGSGKTSLIKHSLVPALGAKLPVVGQEWEAPQQNSILKLIAGCEHLSQVVVVNQEPLARSTRSNIATYLGIFTEIRKLLAKTPEAIVRKMGPGAFSFNVVGGRCEVCKGLGTEIDDLSFLGEMEVICRSCQGKRFQSEVLKVQYQNLSILDILNLTITECREVFYGIPKLIKVFDDVLRLGLGYLRLGQNTSRFSGGEAQRLKLLGLVKSSQLDRPSLLVFDEPSAGLSDEDCLRLQEYFESIMSNGHTIVVIDHNLTMMARADWVIELGPGAGNSGGTVIFQGTVAEMLKATNSITAAYLKEYLYEGKSV